MYVAGLSGEVCECWESSGEEFPAVPFTFFQLLLSQGKL